MNRANFPLIAVAVGCVLLLGVMFGSQPDAQGVRTILPLFTLLAMSEVGFIVTVIGVVAGVRSVLASGLRPAPLAAIVVCLVLAVRFAFYGFALWPR